MTEDRHPTTDADALAARLERLAQRRGAASPSAPRPGTPRHAPSRPATAEPTRSRRHPAKAARYAAAGLSIASTAGLTSLFAFEAAGQSQQLAGATVVAASSTQAQASAASPVGTTATTTRAATPTVVDGAVFSNRWGEVQVEVTFAADGSLTSVDAIQTPNDRGKSIQINDFAVPRLDAEAVSIQSASVHTISGATYTSNGYRQSLQSAIDAARAAGVTQLS